MVEKHANSLVNSKFYPLLLFFVSFVFVTLFSRSTSFLYVYEGFDAAIFKQMGLAVLRGKTMYVDYFDNKGCILYFIHAVGIWIGNNFILLMMQVISLTITLVIWDKLLGFYRCGCERFICISIALSLVLCFYDGGDLTEEWCLPFASYPLLVCFRSLKFGQKISSMNWFFMGFCFGVIAFIRINNACPFLGFVAFIWIRYLLNKDFKEFFKSLALFVLGITIITGVCVIYFYLKAGWNGVYQMVYATFLSYFEYFARPINKNIFHYVFYVMCLLSFIALLCVNAAKQKEILIPALLSCAFFILSSGTHCFGHYLLSLIPLAILLLMTFDFKRNRWGNLALCLFAFIPMIIYLIQPIGFAVNDLVLGKEKFKTIYEDFHQCIETIPETERDSIYNYNTSGIGCGMMQHEGLLQCNRVFYSPLAFNLPTLRRIESENAKVLPKWILISWNQHYDRKDALIIINRYELHCSFIFNSILLVLR